MNYVSKNIYYISVSNSLFYFYFCETTCSVSVVVSPRSQWLGGTGALRSERCSIKRGQNLEGYQFLFDGGNTNISSSLLRRVPSPSRRRVPSPSRPAKNLRREAGSLRSEQRSFLRRGKWRLVGGIGPLIILYLLYFLYKR